MLEQLDRELNGSGTHMAFVEMRASPPGPGAALWAPQDTRRSRFYPTLEAGLAAIQEG